MYRLATVCALILTLTRAGLAVPTNDGIYAEMHTTLGTIELELYFEEAPRTVANFMSLSDGSRSYVNVTAIEIEEQASCPSLPSS